MRNTIDESPF